MRVHLKAGRPSPFWRRLAGRLGLLCAAGLVGLLPAPDVVPADAGGDLGMGPGGGELLQFEEFPTVVSVTRQASGSNMSSVPVTVITAKEIHERGAMTLPQLFEFVPGMDVVRADRNRTAIGIRGMFGVLNDRVLSLVDGAKTAEVVSGATNFQNFPVFMEDIQQIEVVRGPSGAAWGANAFYGVINVITKDPADTQGFLVSSTVDQFGDSHSQFRWGGKGGEARWRISAGLESHKSTANALDKDTPAVDGGYTVTADSRLIVESDARTKMTFGFSYLHQEEDTPTVLSYRPNLDVRRDMVRGFLRYDLELSDALTTTWNALYNYSDSRWPSAYSSIDRETGLEGQFDYTGLENHKIGFGASFRYVHSQAYRFGPEDWASIDNPNTETWGGVFLVDRYQVNSRLWVEMQGRGDLFKFNQKTAQKGDWSGRLALIYALDEAQNQVFRISGAKSYRAPAQSVRASVLHRIALPTPPFPPNTYAANVTPAASIHTETIWSLEAGYTGRMNQNWNVQANVFYHRLFGLISAEKTATLGPAEYYTIDNLDGATGYGGEFEVEYRKQNLHVRAWYAYAGFHPDTRKTILRATPPALNKAGASLEYVFQTDWTAVLNYRYNDQTPGDGGAAQSARVFHQMDLMLLYQIPSLNAELLVGVTDVFNDTALGYEDVFTINTPEVTPGRTFVARGQVNF